MFVFQRHNLCPGNLNLGYALKDFSAMLCDFGYRYIRLVDLLLLSQGYKVLCLEKRLKKFYCRYQRSHTEIPEISQGNGE